MKILILAAGMGNRLKELTEDLPKALVKVGGVPLIDRMLVFATNLDVTEIGVVAGYQSEKLKSHLAGKNVTIFENPEYTLGNICTVASAEEFISGDVLIMNVDHIYPKELLEHIRRNSSGITAMCDFDRALVHDDMKIALDKNKKLSQISKSLSKFDGGYIGMTFCGKDQNALYKEYLRKTIATLGKTACAENILGALAADGHTVNICDTSGWRWLEVDTQEDLAIAEAVLKHEASPPL